MIKRSIIIILLLAAIAGCKEPAKTKKESAEKTSLASTHFSQLKDSINHCWQVMSNNEEEMFFSMNRLLQEIEYIPGHNPLPLDTLRKSLEATKALRYTKKNLDAPGIIDDYDKNLSPLVTNINRFAESVKGIERYQAAAPLLEDLNQRYQNIYLDRVHYNFFIDDYNTLLKKNRKQLEKAGMPQDSLIPLAKF